MFGILNLFGNRPSKDVSKETRNNNNNANVITTISKLKNQVELLNKRNTFVESNIATLKTEIVEVSKTNKKKALILLDKMKRMESEVVKNEGVKSLLEKQISALESSVINKQVTDALREGNNVVKNSQKSVNVDQIEDLMDDIRETEDIQQTIADAFSRNIQDVCENPDLLNELEEMMRGEQQLSNTPPVIMPVVPKRPIAISTEEIELNNLRESMLA